MAKTGVAAYTVLGVAVFVAAAAVGFLMPYSAIGEVLRGMSSLAALDPLSRFIAIFVNNVTVLSIMLLASFLVVPGYALLAINGYILGSAMAYSSLPLPLLLARILPHGSLEVAAYAFTVGTVTTIVHESLRRRLVLRRAAEAVLAAYAVSIYLLLAAAFIESFIVMAH